MYVIIIGGGRTGSHLASLLSSQGHEVRVVEQRLDILANVHHELPTEIIYEGDGTDPQVLETLDIQRDHRSLVRAAMAVLRDKGRLYFSTNRRGFRFDPMLLEMYACEEITGQTLDPDFRRQPVAHRCWSIRHRDGE